MNLGRTIFAQLVEQLPGKEFQKCVARYGDDSLSEEIFLCWINFWRWRLPN